MFGESNIGDTGHEGHNKAAAMADADEVCGCNGVSKGAICKAIKDKGLFTLDEVRKHTKASASCGSCTGLVEQMLMFTAGGDYSAAPKKKAMCGCTDHSHEEVRDADPQADAAAADASPPCTARSEWRTPNGCASCRPALNYYLITTWPKEAKDDPQSRYINERSHANIQKDGTLLGDPAHVGRRDDGRRAAAHRRRGRQVPDPDGQGHRRPAHRPARREEGGPARRLAATSACPRGHAYAKALRTVKTCVGSEWCRFGTQDSTQMGKDLERALWRMYAPHKVKLAVSGCPRNCAESGIKDVGVIGVDSGWEIYVAGNGGIKTEVGAVLLQGEDRRGGAGVQPAPSCSSTARKAGTSSARCTTSAASASTTSSSSVLDDARGPQGAVGAAAVRARRRARSVVRARQGAGRRAPVRSDRWRAQADCMKRHDWTRSAASRTSRCSARAAWRAPRAAWTSRSSAPPRTRCSRCSTAARTRAGRCSQGIVFGDSVACPLHNWTIGLDDGCAKAPDEGCAQRFSVPASTTAACRSTRRTERARHRRAPKARAA